jgi:hypothetical protein
MDRPRGGNICNTIIHSHHIIPWNGRLIYVIHSPAPTNKLEKNEDGTIHVLVCYSFNFFDTSRPILSSTTIPPTGIFCGVDEAIRSKESVTCIKVDRRHVQTNFET